MDLEGRVFGKYGLKVRNSLLRGQIRFWAFLGLPRALLRKSTAGRQNDGRLQHCEANRGGASKRPGNCPPKGPGPQIDQAYG